MKMLLALVTLSLAFATGFTCSKQTTVEETAPVQQEEMANPAGDMPPSDGMPMDGTAPVDGAAPTETMPADEAAPAAPTN